MLLYMGVKHRVIVFDLDDTLYKEVDYLKSAYHEIAGFIEQQFMVGGVYEKMINFWQKGDNTFAKIISYYKLPITIAQLLKMYREHIPDIHLDEFTSRTLTVLSQTCTLGLITDGRSLTQRNKIKALGLYNYFEDSNILISEETGYEKPALKPYLYFMNKYPGCLYYYIGNDLVKDFVAPIELGWLAICLIDDGRNIQKQK